MSRRHVSAFVDALVAGRQPGRFRADHDDDDAAVRMAIELRAARPGDAKPDEQFIASLYEELADQSQRVVPMIRPARASRGRAALVAAAASVALVGGTAAVTDVLVQGASVPAAVQVPHLGRMQTGTFETPGDVVLGQIVAYGGHPSWVYMDLAGAASGASAYSGPIVCMLHGANGSTVAVGAFDAHGGTAEYSKTVHRDFGQLSGATLVTATGAVLATASFS